MLRKDSNLLDLRPYAKHIITAYRNHCNTVTVRVYKHYYIIYGYISRSQIINAGIDIARSSLGKYAIYYPINPKPGQRHHRYLFIGKTVKNPISLIYYKYNKLNNKEVLLS
jgi:hypothetical protein